MDIDNNSIDAGKSSNILTVEEAASIFAKAQAGFIKTGRCWAE